MLFAMLVLVLATEPASRDDIITGTLEFDLKLNEIEARLARGFDINITRPEFGFTFASEEVIGPDGLHAVLVESVFGDGPAQKEGIRPGDRIVAIGTRKLEHEPDGVVNELLYGPPGPVTLTLRRDGKPDWQVSISGTLMLCREQVIASINQPKWADYITRYRLASSTLRKKAMDAATTQQELVNTGITLVNLLEVFAESEDLLQSELYLTTRMACKVELSSALLKALSHPPSRP